MNLETINRSSGAAISFVLAIVLFVAAAVVVKFAVQPPAIDADRGAERSKALAEITAVEEQSLNTLAWRDETRGLVRLPIETAIQLAAKKWSSPAAARAELNAREEKASAPAPVVPAKPSAFE
jgi:hypothetical protein